MCNAVAGVQRESRLPELHLLTVFHNVYGKQTDDSKSPPNMNA